VTGGGTAGHVLPALAVAEALVESGHRSDEVHYVGCTRGIETRLVPPTGFAHTFFDVVGFQRSLSRRNLAFIPKMLRSRRAAVRLLRRLRPSVVVSVGGYASMPAVFAAKKLRIPIVVVSYDRRPGRASMIAARSAAACAVAFDNSPLPRATVTGAPVRQEILTLDRAVQRADARQHLAIPEDRFLVAVMGGSQGSGVLNEAIERYLVAHVDDASLACRQVAGDRFVDDVATIRPIGDGLIHQVVGYEMDMASVYAAADVLIGRGGASTVHEVAVTGIPAILVPWSGAAEDHQRENVEWLAEVGAAVLITENQLGAPAGSQLGVAIDRLRSDNSACDALSVAARRQGEVHRSGALADLIERVAVTSRPS
jgi:UDP-N-acetylglucosamine--N-acetylmuramyl-(pentapeptide) pyrophosphoryl-undecaprenol N-acetylglucosamine transferase